jgi:hypothetical protein
MTKIEQRRKLIAAADDDPWLEVNGSWLEVSGRMVNGDLFAAMLDDYAALLEVVEVARAGPCRHTGSHRGDDCPLCAALAKWEAQP